LGFYISTFIDFRGLIHWFRDLPFCKQIHEIEQGAKNSGIQNVCVIRYSALQEFLFWFAPMINKEQRLCLPLRPDEGKWAPLNIKDLCLYVTRRKCKRSLTDRFVAHILSEKQEGAMKGEMYRLTGQDLITAKQLVERLNKAVGQSDIKYEEAKHEVLH
jgi:hypothetical protein